ncbi:MAG TPA: 3-oxoacyl-ACP reductase [Solirubrobacteraceae bacterium]|nr:3-oxoacyl-ACP reductase [Solirubrobacteraceae bacterium]
MSDPYLQFVNSPPGAAIARQLGLPRPVRLERHRLGDPVIRGRVLLGGSSAPIGSPPMAGGRQAAAGGLLQEIVAVLREAGCELATGNEAPLRELVAQAGMDATVFNGEAPGGQRLKALVFDASTIADSRGLAEMHGFFHGSVRQLERCGRVIVLGTPPADCDSVRQATAQRALEGFTRSLGKELGRGATVQLVLVAPDAGAGLASTLRFLLSPRSAYVSGQVIHVGAPGASAAAVPAQLDWERPQAGRVALVTGASRGIGEAIATTLAREGAHVVGLDVPALADELEQVSTRLGGEALVLDVTAAETPAAIAERFSDGVDVVVHNAGVTRDRTLAKMPAERWSELMDINLSSQERIDEALLAAGAIRPGGRIVCVSSMSGIAGNAGQTNYATSKAGVIGRVQALAGELAGRGATINAVAPGFIETRMTAAMPIPIREAGRRMSSLGQGGEPVDVAETIAWLAHPASGAVNGNVVRVCGQNFLGA